MDTFTRVIREVVVCGTPVSLQAKGRTRPQWQARVAAAAHEQIAEEDRLEYGSVTDIEVSLTYFHFGEMEGDLDNIAKPILDALTGPLWSSDRLISSLHLRRVRVDRVEPRPLVDPPILVTRALDDATSNGTDFIYVTASADDWNGADEPSARIPRAARS